MMAEPVSGPVVPARDLAHRYLRAGLSLLPVAPQSKEPFHLLLPESVDEEGVVTGKREWGQWSRFMPEPSVIDFWFSHYPKVGIGVVCGAVSGHLQVLDVDDGLFSRWLEPRLPKLGPLGTTWSVKTGSGKLHVYLRSEKPLGLGEHKLIDQRDGRKLADIRGEGSYVAAPPSFVVTPTNPKGGVYETFLGSPESIVRCPDGLKVWQALALGYGQNGHPAAGQEEVGRVVGGSNKYSRSIRPAAVGEELVRLREAITKVQSARARRAVLEGAQLGDPPWNASDWSDLDWRIVKEILQAGGLDDEQLEAAWATFPIGEHTYRNPLRPNHGKAYLLGYTIPKAREAFEREKEQASKASGQNFSIVSARIVNYEEPVIELQIERTDVVPHTTHHISVSNQEFWNERAFAMAAFRQMHWVLQQQGAHMTSAGYRQFIAAVSNILQIVEPPSGATETGQLWTLLRRTISDRLAGHEGVPEKASEVRFGWKSDGYAFVSASALIAHFRQEMRHPPKAKEVWEALEEKGARSQWVEIGRRREEMWKIRVELLD